MLNQPVNNIHHQPTGLQSVKPQYKESSMTHKFHLEENDSLMTEQK
jgi:hypothetical protein